MIAEAVYLLCAVASLACAGLLLRSYARARLPLILWTSVCFTALAIQNVLLFVDLVLVPDIHLILLRNAIGLAGLCVLLFGLIAVGTERSGG